MKKITWVSALVCLILLVPSVAFPQAANGTITGTVSDATGAVLPGASVDVKNSATGVVFSTISTETGAYTAPNLPPGSYAITISLPGFKKYDRSGVSLSAAQVLRVDVGLEVGAASESVTITEEGTLLKTETGDVAHNITVSQLVDLPILGIGNANAGSSGVRNPYNTATTVPGVNYVANSSMIVNGAPTNTAAYRLEGLDNTNHTVAFALQENQPSADAIQEVAVQTSNYAPEFGQAGGGLFNVTMKSGTSQFHGSGYEYFVNEWLNAGNPYTVKTDGTGNVRPRNRRSDFGGTLGGPIPFLTKGNQKTFFFFSLERFKESSLLSFSDTVPTLAMRNGDFSGIFGDPTNPNLIPGLGVPRTSIGTDALGRPIYANQIYDPNTRGTTGSGQGFANPFQGNIIPADRITPFAKAVMALIPLPQNNNLTNNYTGTNISDRVTGIPSVKIDHQLNEKNKFSFYWSTTGTESQFSTPNGNADGLPDLISQARGTFIDSTTMRLNYDRVLSNSMLLHMGSGWSQIVFIDDSPITHSGKKFDCTTINLPGCQASINFPTFTSMVPTGSLSGLGGMQQMGNALVHTHTVTQRPAFNTNMTWLRGSHNFKWGSEVWFQGNMTAPPSGVSMTFAVNATAQPFTVPQGLGGQQMGNQFASFLLGDASTVTQTAPTGTRMGKSQWALYWQDSWRTTRKLTLDYGLRWDYATAPREQYGRSADLGVTTPNPAVGGYLGAAIFQSTCNCDFMKTYPYAFGPRFGFAYQLSSKTVMRGGWGFAYGFAPDVNVNTSASQASTPAGTNAFLNVSAPTALPQPVWPNFDPAQTPLPGQITGFTGFTLLDRNAARPPRQNQYSIGIQREVTGNLIVDASYVGNRGVWWPGPLGQLNQVSPARFAQFGLDPYHNATDNLLLSSPLSSAAVQARVGNFLPYPGYSTANTLINALRPFPQFSTITVTNSPTGNTYYDSLQLKVTKRMSRGVQVSGNYTFSKAMISTRQDIFNPASSSKSIQSTDQPHILSFNILYQTTKYFGDNIASWLTKDWQVGAFATYASGLPLAPPAANVTNNLPGGSAMVRTGEPLYVKDINCHCFDPQHDVVLNPAAWTNPTPGTYGPGPSSLTPIVGPNTLYYSDFRGPRRPSESFNITRSFALKGGDRPVKLSVRADFSNIFNRAILATPFTTSPVNASNVVQTPGKDGAGRYNSGYGVILEAFSPGAVPTSSGAAAAQLPRQGTLVARIIF
jgi:Carboxypeptidase regulatory-like domain